MKDTDAAQTAPKPANPTRTRAWQELAALAAQGRDNPIAGYFRVDRDRAQRYSLRCGELFLDYSKNRVDDEVLGKLLALAAEMRLPAAVRAMFDGDNVNVTERRPALHMALRGASDPLGRGSADWAGAVAGELEKMRDLSEQVRSGAFRGATGMAITDVINIGIGGSDMGPKMVCRALREYGHPGIRCHFIANVDGAEIHSLLAGLDPQSTLVIVASKSFTTQETRLNTETTLAWFENTLGLPRSEVLRHFIGITENVPLAREFGLVDPQIFKMWDWVGGRYSLWSSIGLVIAISIGFDGFDQLLAGAAAMDRHFYTAPLAENMPVMLALLGIWYRNFLGAETQAVVPYCQRLGDFIGHLQQLDMESCGKSVSVDGEAVGYATGTVIWGQTGTNGQHSFFQLIHQGTHLIPVDFIGVIADPLSDPAHHRPLLSHMLAQAAALMEGRSGEDLPAAQYQPGNRPSNVLLLDRLTPYNLGSLI